MLRNGVLNSKQLQPDFSDHPQVVEIWDADDVSCALLIFFCVENKNVRTTAHYC
jgi:hypothetical protein